MKRRSVLKGIAATSAALAMPHVAGPARAAKPLTLSFSAFSGSANPSHVRTVDRMIAEIEAASNGEVKFETYFGGSAYGNPQQQFEQVRRGIVDLAGSLFGYTPGRFPMTDLLELPFLFNDSVAASKAFWATWEEFLKREYPGVKPITLWLTSMQHLQLRRPVRKLEDLSGLKIRVGSASMGEALARLGAEGLALPATGIYESLQKGVLDGTVGAWGMLSAFKVGEVTNFHLQVDMTAAPVFIFMNQRKYDSLPAEVKALFDAYSNEKTVVEFAEAFKIPDGPGLKIANSEGHTKAVLSPEERQRWQEATRPVVETTIKSLENRGLPARAFLDRFLAEVKARS